MSASRSTSKAILIGGGIVVAILATIAVVNLVFNQGEADKDWPTEVGGRAPGLGSTDQKAPDVLLEADPGLYLWNDFDGWHLWVVNGDGVDGAKGTISSDEDFGDTTLAVPDVGTQTTDGQVIVFDLPADVDVAGIDFNPNLFADRLTVELDDTDPASITLGTDGEVTEVPFTIDKVES